MWVKLHNLFFLLISKLLNRHFPMVNYSNQPWNRWLCKHIRVLGFIPLGHFLHLNGYYNFSLKFIRVIKFYLVIVIDNSSRSTGLETLFNYQMLSWQRTVWFKILQHLIWSLQVIFEVNNETNKRKPATNMINISALKKTACIDSVWQILWHCRLKKKKKNRRNKTYLKTEYILPPFIQHHVNKNPNEKSTIYHENVFLTVYSSFNHYNHHSFPCN